MNLCLFWKFWRLEVFDHTKFDKWVEKGAAPAIAPSLKLYQRVIDLGYRVFLLTGRKESHRLVTVENLINAGFQNWDKLILRYILTHINTSSSLVLLLKLYLFGLADLQMNSTRWRRCTNLRRGMRWWKRDIGLEAIQVTNGVICWVPPCLNDLSNLQIQCTISLEEWRVWRHRELYSIIFSKLYRLAYLLTRG